MDKGKRPANRATQEEWRRNKKLEAEQLARKKEFDERIFSHKLERMRDREEKKGKDWVQTKMEYRDYYLMDWEKLDVIYEKQKEMDKLVRLGRMSKQDCDAEVKRMYAEYDMTEEEKIVAEEKEIAKYVEEHEARAHEIAKKRRS